MSVSQKNIALVIGFLLFLWIAYQLSFSKTIALKKQYVTMKNEMELFDNSTQRLLYLQKENAYYDSILKSKRISTDKSFQNNLLSTITTFADTTNVTLKTFSQPHVYQQEDTEILTYTIILHGHFNYILRLIYMLEQEVKLGKIISVHYEKKKDYRRGTTYLECTLLLQRIESG